MRLKAEEGHRSWRLVEEIRGVGARRLCAQEEYRSWAP